MICPWSINGLMLTSSEDERTIANKLAREEKVFSAPPSLDHIADRSEASKRARTDGQGGSRVEEGPNTTGMLVAKFD